MFLNILQYSQETTVLETLFDKIADLHDCNFIKKRVQHRCFPVNIVKFFYNTYFLGGDYMIPVGRDEIPSRFAGIPACFKFFIKSILLLHVKVNQGYLQRKSTLKQDSNAYEKYEYRHLGRWYIKSTLFKRLLN